MEINFIAVLVAALVPLVLGFIWYNPKFLGTAWMRETGLTEEKMKSANMGVIFGVSFVLAFLLAFIMQPLTIHQFGALGMVGADVDNALPSFQAFMDDYATNHRTFGHGAFHGFMAGIFLVLPILGTNGMFERKSWKLIMINVGYWSVALALMGGIVCGWV